MEPTEDITQQRTASLSGSSGPVPAREIVIPERIGTVQLIRELGRGGMGVVWLGRDEMLNRDVAVKFMLQAVSTTDDPNFSQFLEGARAAAAVNHPGLTVLHHADLYDGLPFLVMEYIDGVSLSQILQERKSLGAPLALAIIRQAAEAVAELHDRGIVHRDIKPANIMIERSGRVVVTDFGLACDRVPVGASVSKRAAGTPMYMSPEMFQGQISPRSDVYALGATLLEMLAGAEAVWDSTENPQQTAEQLQQRNIDAPLIDLVERSMNRNALYRLKTARQFLTALPAEKGGSRTYSQELAALVSPELLKSEGRSHASQGDSSQFRSLGDLAHQRRQRPEAAIKPEPRPAPEGASLPGAVGFDLPCINCHYNLRATQLEGVCPECGTPVTRSTRADRLHFAPTGWLKKVRSGCGWGRIGVWWTLVMLLPATILAEQESLRFLGLTFDTYLTVVALALFLIGAWQLTAVNTNQPFKTWTNLVRLFLRAALVCIGLFNAGTLAVEIAGVKSHRVSEFLESLEGVELVMLWLGLAGATGYLHILARRIPDQIMSKRCRTLTISAAVMGGLYLVFLLFFDAHIAKLEAEDFKPTVMQAVGYIVGAIVFFGAQLVLMILFERQLRRFARIISGLLLPTARPPSS